jgi:hypothetical protein
MTQNAGVNTSALLEYKHLLDLVMLLRLLQVLPPR